VFVAFPAIHNWHRACFIKGHMQANHFKDTAERPADTFDFKAILLVDDDRKLASALQWILADESFMVDVAHDGEEALMKIRANIYDAVICDVMMPRLNGDQLYMKSRQLRPVLADRFIFITGHAADPRVQSFLASTGSKYLAKPFRVEQLIGCVRELLAGTPSA
jgi:DNA-binding response OmpR family regulator